MTDDQSVDRSYTYAEAVIRWISWLFFCGVYLIASEGFGLRNPWVARGIAVDVFYTALGLENDPAHWAHLGGFLAGVVIALVLPVTRLANARGGDILSAILGHRAWALIGKPNRPVKTL